MFHLILYSKPGCHLCEGIQEKLASLVSLELELEIRDITTREDWWEAYQYEIPVLYLRQDNREIPIPRPSPRLSVLQLEQKLQKFLSNYT
jgi:hypothetical protein